MLWRRASALARLSQSPCCVGGSPPISRTPPGFGLSAPFAFSDTTATVILVPSYTMAYLTGEMVWTVPDSGRIRRHSRQHQSANHSQTGRLRKLTWMRIRMIPVTLETTTARSMNRRLGFAAVVTAVIGMGLVPAWNIHIVPESVRRFSISGTTSSTKTNMKRLSHT